MSGLRVGATIFFVRHGETDWNREGRLQGQRDVPLNALGRAQADAVADRLRPIAPGFEDFDYVASPLGRTRDTMERLRAALGLDPAGYRQDERWKELSFGAWEGLTWREVRARDPKGAAARERDKWGFTPPDGESYAALAERVSPALGELRRDTVLVAHGGVARVLLALVAGLDPAEAPRADIWQGRVLVIEKGMFRWA